MNAENPATPVDRKTKKRRSRPLSTEGVRKRNKMRKRNTDNGDDSSGSAAKRRPGRLSKDKTLDQLCDELGIDDVELTYSTDDFENWTVQKLFNQYVQPLMAKKNPNAPMEHIKQILDAKWKEFAIMNPYIPKGEEESRQKSILVSGKKDLPDDDELEPSGTISAVSVPIPLEADDATLAPSTSSIARRASSRQLRAVAVVADATVSGSTPGGLESEEISQSSHASQSSTAATPLTSSQAPLKIKISKKKKKKFIAGRVVGKRADGKRGGDNTSDEEFERQLQEAEALQEEQKLRKHRGGGGGAGGGSAKKAAVGGVVDDAVSISTVANMHVSASAPNLTRPSMKRSGAGGVSIARVPLMGGTRTTLAGEDGYETDHQDYCDVCQQGGEIMLCDTCPRAYHLVCLDPELEEPPEGFWCCPHCEKQGINAAEVLAARKAAATREYDEGGASTASEGPVRVPRKAGVAAIAADADEEKDEHQEFCSECRDGGDLICCESCPASYHLGCLDPPLSQIPEGVWLCPRCGCRPPKGRVSRILFWRWREPPKSLSEGKRSLPVAEPEEDDSNAPLTIDLQDPAVATQQKPPVVMTARRRPSREFFVKLHEMSYWTCEWVTELQLEVFHSLMLRVYSKKYDMDEPPPPEDGSSYRGRAREKAPDPQNLEERFYKWGVRPEWLQPQRIIDNRTNRDKTWYLVKWRDLPYDDCTWEDASITEVPDFERFVDEYKMMRGLFKGEHAQGGKKKHPKKGHSSSAQSLSSVYSSNLLKKIPPEKPINDLRKQLTKQPEYMDDTGGQLHPYQLDGLNWLRFSYANRVDTILADEMGLGKTIQTISFLYSLYKDGHSRGPFLVAAPLSTIINWEREFEFWAPDFYVVTYVGDKDSRTVIREHEFTFDEGGVRGGSRVVKMRSGTQVRFHVLLTSYELISIDQALLSSIDWEVLVVDEAHRLKNNQSKFFRMLTTYKIAYKLLLTGTPLQNNLEELFHLLHFMSPAKFTDMQGFLDEFADISKEDQVKKLHEMLGKHLLRRLKADVLKNMPSKGEFIVRVELSPMQKKFYKFILTKNFDALSCRGGGTQPSLINVMMDLKKCCNHPYLFPAASEDAPRYPNGAYEVHSLRKACGKLELLSTMLKKLKAGNHRVLIFSQMTKMLDLLEDFLEAESYKFERIDGNVTGQQRQDAIDRFNALDSSSFVFLLSTRAGGLGINLATADTVIIYDSDWNPHNDIQAFSRAHRIGQANKVMIYRFVTRATVEERVTQVAKKKMMLTHLVVRPGLGGKGASQMSKKELDDILKFGTEDLFKHEGSDDTDEHCIVYNDAALDRLLDRSQQGMEEKQLEMNDYLSSFKVAHYEKREIQDGDEDSDDEEDANVEVIKQELDTSDPAYWEKLLRHHFEQAQEDQAKMLGKGKRHRKPVNYWANQQEDEEEWNDNTSEHDSNFSTRDEEDDEYDEKTGGNGGEASQIGRRVRRERECKMPALLTRVNGQIEVLGFNMRQRRAFVNSVMRYGLPPADQNACVSAWHSRDLKGKPERVFRTYISLFMRHLCEPESMNQETTTYSDGTPRDGISHQHILSRIGIMALVRKKVQEFEQINGEYSMPELMPKKDAELPRDPSGSGPTRPDTPSTHRNPTATPKSEQTPVTATPPADSSTSMTQPLTVNTEPGSGGTACSDDASKASDKTEPMDISLSTIVAVEDGAKDPDTSEDSKKSEESDHHRKLVEEADDADVVEDAASVAIEDGCDSYGETDDVKIVPTTTAPVEEEEGEEVEQQPTSNKSSVDGGAAPATKTFMFNIADGGFTELHTIWLNEQRAIQENPGAFEIWHRKHDYWLLAGVVQHGYGRWQDIHNDARFALVNEPFRGEQGKPNYLEMKNRFLARRFKLIEQALIIEEQLRRAAHQNIGCDPKDSVQNLNRRFNELECLAVAQQQIFAEAFAGNKALVPLLHRALTMMEEYLAEMKQDVSRLLTVVPRMPPVAARLNLSHTGLLTKLTQQLTAAKQAKLAALQQQQQQLLQSEQQAASTSNPPTPVAAAPAAATEVSGIVDEQHRA